ncbi:MAG: ABC transporter permease, partial [Saprospiraceae bacterium]
MFNNYITIAFRNLLKNKTFSLINIIGLAMGLAVFLMIMLWVKNEKSYNDFHVDKDRISAIMTNQIFGTNDIATFPAVPSLLASALIKDLPGIESATTTSWGENRQFSVNNKEFIEYGLYVSPEFLKIFTFPLTKGNADNSLLQPNTILITEKLAFKYFGTEDPIGKTIMIEQNTPYKVEGIIKNIPANATLTFDFLMPVKDYISANMSNGESWDINNMRAYLKLKPGVDRNQINTSLKTFLNHYSDKQAKSELILWDLNDWYLRFDFKQGKYAGGGRIIYIRMFTMIALFILFLACINFMNLSTARATKRSKEVGVRKVIGAGRLSLITQFLSESVLFSVLAGIIALGLVSLALPAFNTFLRRKIELNVDDFNNVVVFVGIILVTGILAGSYPAIVLSSFRPVKVFKNILTSSISNTTWIRKALMVMQFIVSIVLIIATMVIAQQINFIKNRNLGYQKEHLIWFPNNIALDKNELALRELKKVPGVKQAAQTSMTFTLANNRGSKVDWPGKAEGQEIFFSFIAASHDVLQTMGITLSEGRSFSTSYVSDTGAYILNEEAVRKMGIKNPIGQTLNSNGNIGPIVGVVKDFHFESLHSPIAPVIFMCRPNWTWNIYVKTDGKDIQATLKGIEEVYKKMAPGFVFDYNFQDKEYERLYRSETQIGVLVRWFAFFAIFISCLGLFGLTTFTVEVKAKEIGIRKVLGASIASILGLISKQFIGL